MKKPPARRPSPAATPDPEKDEHQVMRVQAEWSGPLPPPAILDDFNHVVDNGAERIFQAWESETRHRHEIERRDLTATAIDTILGKIFAFLFVLAALAVCAVAVVWDAPWVAGLLGSGVIGSVVWAFVKVNRKPNK